MKRILMFLSVLLLFTACNGQTENKSQTAKSDTTAVAGQSMPKVVIKVNKIYDDSGKVIGYDSTYSWSYSNISGDSVLTVNPDSLFSEFKPLLKHEFPEFLPDKDFLTNDSLFYNGFFKQDYFFDRWYKQMEETEKMLRRMDSLKNSFLYMNYPGLQRKEKKK